MPSVERRAPSAERLAQRASSFMLCGLALVACGTRTDLDGGGGDNLPSRGIVPFDKPEDPDDPASELPFVWIDEAAALSEPSALVTNGRVALYVQADGAGATVIRRSESADGVAFSDDRVVLMPEQSWEEDFVGAPSVLARGGEILMWYLGGRDNPALGLARSTDGLTFTREPDPVLEAEPGEGFVGPSVVELGGRLVLYIGVETGDAGDGPRRPTTIHRADSADGVAWERQGVVLDLESGCLGNDGEPVRCWDDSYVTSPAARVSTSPAGRTLIDVWYTGGNSSNSGIGFAGSYDGRSFARYRLNPVVNGGGPEDGPALVDFRGTLVMYFDDERGSSTAIGVALQDP